MTEPVPALGLSLKLRLAVGAALLGAGTVLTALVLAWGLNEVASRLDAAIASENRMARYSILSTQASTFLVVATEAVQTGQPTQIRIDRLNTLTEQMQKTFEQLHSDVEAAVTAARAMGLDEQSRYATQSLGIARMQATLDATLQGLGAPTQDPTTLRPHLDRFATSIDQLLSQALNTEVLFRNSILTGIDRLRLRLILVSFGIAAVALSAVAVFYLGLIRPQFRRLDDLRRAAQQIGEEDFSIALPVTRQDEIGQLAAMTNRSAATLLARKNDVQAEWARLNDTIAERTEALRAANAALAETDEKRRRFFADISHELRTPLTVILMEAQLGRKGMPDPEHAFATIEARAIRLNRRIDDLLRLARSDTGELALDPQTVALSSLIGDVRTEIQAEIDNAGMDLEVAKMPDIPVRCDPNWARQVIASLVRNAIRHARGGIRLRIEPLEDETHAGVQILDNGPGIELADQRRVFDRFVQGASATAGQGFGVGLALARWVIEAQHGDIALISPVPRAGALGNAPGTKISVRLPKDTP